MEEKDNIKKDFVDLYSNQSEEQRRNIDAITYLKGLEFSDPAAIAKYLQKDVFILESSFDENNKKVQKQEVYIKNNGEYLKIADLTEKGIVFTEEYLEYVKNINELLFDTINKQNGKKIEFDEQTVLESKKIEKDELEKEKNKNDKELQREDSQENSDEEIENDEVNIKKIAEKTGISESELNSCASIDPEQKITNEKSFEDITHTKGEYKKVIAVNADSKSRGTSRFAFWGVKKDGTVEQIPELEERDGVNTGKDICTINRDGSEITKKQTAALFSLEGKEEGFSLRIGQYGIMEVDYIRRIPEQGNMPLSIPVETSRDIHPTQKQVREFMNDSLTSKDKLRQATDNANRQLDGVADKEAEVERTNLSQITKDTNMEAIQVDEEITLYNGKTTTIMKEAQNLDMSLEEYKEKFANLKVNSISDKVMLIREEKSMEHTREEERTREERMTPEEEAMARENRRRMMEMMKRK